MSSEVGRGGCLTTGPRAVLSSFLQVVLNEDIASGSTVMCCIMPGGIHESDPCPTVDEDLYCLHTAVLASHHQGCSESKGSSVKLREKALGRGTEVLVTQTQAHLYTGLPLKVVQKPQLVQNVASHVITGARFCWAADLVAALAANLFPSPIQCASFGF